jgi:hypothetical protein
MAVRINKKINKKTILVEVEVDDDIEAYKIVSELAFEFNVLSAKYGELKEKFNKENTPFHFLKNNKNNKKSFRDIRTERLK